MPVGFNSPARNLFLLGSSGAQVVTNFFQQIDQSATTDNFFVPDEIRYNVVDQKYILAGSAEDANSQGYGWFEKRDEFGVGEWGNAIQSFNSSDDTTLRSMELDSNNNLIVAGKTGQFPWIGRFTNDGNFDWMSSTYSADVRYLGVTSNGGNYYACGATPGTGDAQAFVEKFDSSGNPGWGKSAIIIGRDVVLRSVAANSRGHVVSVGYLEDNIYDKGYIVKVDTNTGDVLWDRTLSPDYGGGMIRCMDCYIDVKDQIYVVARDDLSGYLLKYSPEGNMIWQTKTPYDGNTPNITMEFLQVQSDGETEQTVTLGKYYDTNNNDMYGLLSKYSKDGSLVWRRTLKSSNDNSDIFRNVSLDADPSFYYILYTDEAVDIPNGEPDQYTFGKVSTSGNGLGAFQYYDGVSTIDYDILNAPDQISRLSDGSVRNDSTDLLSYPFNANKIVFDDLATQVTNKKRQMDDAGSFEYSGSPAIRPADFQELNLLGESIFIGPELITNGDFSNGTTGWTISDAAEGSMAVVSGQLVLTNNDTSDPPVYAWQEITTVSGKRYTLTVDIVGGTSASQAVYVNDSSSFGTAYGQVNDNDGAGTKRLSFEAAGASVYILCRVNANQAATSIFDNVSVKENAWLDRSGKGNDGKVFGGLTATVDEYWEFSGTDNEVISGPKCNTLFDDGGSGTIEMWVKPNDVTTRQTLCSGYMTTGSTQPDRWDFEIRDGALRGGSHDNTFFTGTTTLSVNTWYHFVFTLDKSSGAGTLKAYVNSAEDQTQTFTLDRDWATDVEFGIGNRFLQRTDFPLDADVGEVRTYRRALTAAAVFQNYNATKSKYTNTRSLTSPPLGTGSRIVVDSNLLLNYDFSIASCIDKSTTVSTTTGEIIVDDATTNGAAFGDGQCVATGYGKVVVGARGETNGVYTAGGKAYIYNAVTGALEVTLTPSDISGNDWNFGNAVAICNCSGRIAVTSSSALYLYDADGTNEVIIDSNSTLPISPPGGNTFGNGLAIDGNRVWVSDDNVPQGPNYSGTVYCFNAETGAFIYELRPNNNLDNFIRYGVRIAAGNGVLAIGAESIAHPVTGRSNTGRVYLYTLDGRNEKILEPDDLTTSALFGTGGLAIGYGMLVVGASRQQRTEDPQSLGNGEVYVFDLQGNLKFSIRPSDDPADEDANASGFGDSVAISSDRIIVGARYYVGNPGGVAGRAYLFEHGGKELQAWIGSGGGDASDFGSSMNAAGGTLVIGAGSGSPDASGRAYIYPVTGTSSGTLNNLANRTYTGTLNGPIFNTADNSFQFDGTDDDIDTGLSWTPANQFSFTMWFNLDTIKEWHNLVDMYVNSTSRNFQLFVEGDGDFRIYWGTTSGTSAITGTVANEWYFGAFTCDGENGDLYRYGNGTTNTVSATAASGTYSVRPLVLGRRGDSNANGFVDGKIGEFQFYNRELTAAEVLQNYNATRARYGV